MRMSAALGYTLSIMESRLPATSVTRAVMLVQYAVFSHTRHKYSNNDCNEFKEIYSNLKPPMRCESPVIRDLHRRMKYIALPSAPDLVEKGQGTGSKLGPDSREAPEAQRRPSRS